MNKIHKTRLSEKIRIEDSPIPGKGMFAISSIEKGETLLVWGNCYTNKEGALQAQRQGKGIMQWDEDIFSYETSENSDYYSINHSCDPNSWMADAYTLIARRMIKPGEEITVDCALFESDEDFVSPWKCNCGSPLCRGRVTGRDWTARELQERYRGHFSPLINKRILSR